MNFAEQARVAFLLIQNAALLALGVMGYYQARHWLQQRMPPRAELLLYGFVVGLLGVLSMFAAIEPATGVRLHLCSALVAVATIVGGLEAGLGATLTIGLGRAVLGLGGPGVAAGFTSLALTFALSGAYLILLRRRGVPVGRRHLAQLGLVVGIVGLAVLGFFLHVDAVTLIFRDIALAWLVLTPLTVVFLGGIALHYERAHVTDRMLREKQRELRAIMDNAPVAIILKDLRRRYRMVNRCFSEWTGYSQEELLGRTTPEAFPAWFAEKADQSDREVIEQGSIARIEMSTVGFKRGRPDLEHALLTKFPIRDETGAIVGIAAFCADITESKRAEAALRQSEERFRALVEYSADTIAVIRPDGTVSYRGPTVAALGLGCEDVDVVGRDALSRVHPEDAGAFAATLEEIARTPGGRVAGRSRMRHKDGSWRHIAWSASNAVGVPGIDGVIFNYHDTTAAVNLELQLAQAHKMEAVGKLAGGIAHDFNNILGVISGFAGFLLQDLPEDAPQHRFAGRIAKAAEDGKHLVQQILSFSRRTGIERKPDDLTAIVREAVELARATLPSSTRIETATPAEPLVASVNAVQITQMLLNLCLNANDALMNEPGEITIELSRVGFGQADHALLADGGVSSVARDGCVILGALRSDRDYARIAVSDTGVGMDQALLDHIFEPFFTTKDRDRGTGLGLAVAHGTIMAYDGACIVTSRPGSGSVFTVYLPLVEAGAAAVVAETGAAASHGHERILIVDDDVGTTDVLTIGLDRLGYEVVALNDPEEALAAIAEDPSAWDVVISDEVMPHMKGLSLFKRLRSLRAAPRFILCSGESGDGDEQSALDEGADAYIRKPVSPEQLAAAIRSVIDQRADRAMAHAS